MAFTNEGSASDWRRRAACRGKATGDWFGHDHAALAVCETCTVQADCLADALRWERGVAWARHGIWGGLTAEGRHRLDDRVPEPGRRLPDGLRTRRRRSSAA